MMRFLMQLKLARILMNCWLLRDGVQSISIDLQRLEKVWLDFTEQGRVNIADFGKLGALSFCQSEEFSGLGWLLIRDCDPVLGECGDHCEIPIKRGAKDEYAGDISQVWEKSEECCNKDSSNEDLP
ncbi:hypothetical protein GIB67_001479 [Kingdonia uniflora]|uniref:Uncharacterized protein n=1 Tax=Kingdonia uniflora TaxID=39325 RepID=A0A7J7LSM6_9MAGN|nr:hypothetical protein GIB67_001479 [Kingdonia uniflora]